MKKIKLERIGCNSLGYVAYKDEAGRVYVDIDCIENEQPDQLYTVSPSNDIDGEAVSPLENEFEIINPLSEKELRMGRFRLEYQLLGRMQADCEAFIGKSGDPEKDRQDCRYRNPQMIWGKDINALISEMKEIWNKIPSDIKPEWISWEDILKYERTVINI